MKNEELQFDQDLVFKEPQVDDHSNQTYTDVDKARIQSETSSIRFEEILFKVRVSEIKTEAITLHAILTFSGLKM